MGIHFFSDILCGAALGALMVLASQRLPIPRVAFKILKLQRKWSVAFCVTMFIATYSLATFGADLRALFNLIVPSFWPTQPIVLNPVLWSPIPWLGNMAPIFGIGQHGEILSYLRGKHLPNKHLYHIDSPWHNGCYLNYGMPIVWANFRALRLWKSSLDSGH
jgi:hypothetical protein